MRALIATLALTTTLSLPGAAAGSSAAEQEKPAVAQTSGGTEADAIRQRVKQGQKVRVTDDQGREWHGRIEALARDNLVLQTRDRQRHDVPYATILRIDRPRDTLSNGAMIGFLSGAALGLLAVVAEDTGTCEGFFGSGDCAVDSAAYVVVPALFGGAGAGIGIGIDALVTRDPTLFRRGAPRVVLTPSLAPGVRGVSLSVRW